MSSIHCAVLVKSISTIMTTYLERRRKKRKRMVARLELANLHNASDAWHAVGLK
jgi:hypothetical protein